MRIPAILSIVLASTGVFHPARAEAPNPPPRPGLVFGWYDPATDRFVPDKAAEQPSAAGIEGTLVVRVTIDLVTPVPADKQITVFVDGQFGDTATYSDYRTFGTAERDGRTASFEFKVPYGVKTTAPTMTVWVDVSTEVGSARPRVSQTLRTPAPKNGGLVVIPVNLAL